MHAFRKLFAASAAAIVAMASGVLVAHADSTPTVYNTPGGQISAGRLWNTTCEKYSTNVVRCRAEIWATQVTYVNGSFVKKTGWTFNNLSYLPSPRASWAGNNLARNNPSWVSGGKTWKTECDNATTGRGGCRSYVWTKKVIAVRSGSGYTYKNNQQWVFNNLVLFSSATVPPVSTVPRWVVDCDGQSIGPKGLKCSPIQLDVDARDLQTLGYVRRDTGGACEFWDPSQSLKNRGIGIDFAANDVYRISVDTNYIPTAAGARVGMTVGEVKAIYDTDFAVVPKQNYGETQYFGTVRQGAFELQFRVAGPGDTYAPAVPLVNSDVVAEISAQRYTNDVSFDGC